MKQAKILLLTTVLTLLAFCAILYTSCKKDPCSGISCLNGGACANGNCICPTGYTGVYCEYATTTTLVYQNNTFTPINITINGTSATIPVGGSVSFSGTPGDSATGSASTSGLNVSGAQVGLNITWAINDGFPTGSTQTEFLNVGSSYFFLKIANNSAYNISQVYVNYGLSSQTLDNVGIYNNGITYSIGYYSAWTNSNLYLTVGSNVWNANLSLPFTQNQSYIFLAD